MKKKRFRALKITLIVLLILVTLFLIFASICVTLAFKDNYTEKYTITDTSISVDISLEIAKAALKGESTDIADRDINAYLSAALDLPKSNSENSLNHLAIHNTTDGAEIYFQITHGKYNFAIFAKTAISLDVQNQRIEAIVQEMKIGELPIPSFMISNILNKFLSQYDFLSVDNCTIFFPAVFTYESAELVIEEFHTNDGGITLKTNPLENEAWELLKDKLEGVVNDIKDNWKDYMQNIKDKWQDTKNKWQDYLNENLTSSEPASE